MSLSPGLRLGSYEIVAPLGAGGMGEVYRATDTKLGRAVAIKVLPAEVAGDTDRLARFKREAQLLASLNHPNVAAVHGLEEAEGKPTLFELERLTTRLQVAPDGRRFLFLSRAPGAPDHDVIRVVLNGFEELRGASGLGRVP